jgi:hypothetical protein
MLVLARWFLALAGFFDNSNRLISVFLEECPVQGSGFRITRSPDHRITRSGFLLSLRLRLRSGLRQQGRIALFTLTRG